MRLRSAVIAAMATAILAGCSIKDVVIKTQLNSINTEQVPQETVAPAQYLFFQYVKGDTTAMLNTIETVRRQTTSLDVMLGVYEANYHRKAGDLSVAQVCLDRAFSALSYPERPDYEKWLEEGPIIPNRVLKYILHDTQGLIHKDWIEYHGVIEAHYEQARDHFRIAHDCEAPHSQAQNHIEELEELVKHK